jgi:hypothetical protein
MIHLMTRFQKSTRVGIATITLAALALVSPSGAILGRRIHRAFLRRG